VGRPFNDCYDHAAYAPGISYGLVQATERVQLGCGLVITFLLSFTGYLLPWDQLAYWAITVGTNMIRAMPFIGHEGPFAFVNQYNDIRFLLLGGTEIGANALLRFYVLHIVVLPAAAVVFMGVHFWRIRKDGGISGPL
jgi:quinol-cytochrome oxidoreductase complex cytochrome b subunit